MDIDGFGTDEQVTLTVYGGTPLSNPGVGGWAYRLRLNGQVIERSGAESVATNNRMELFAVIAGLESTSACNIRIVSDSQYLVRGGSKLPIWKRFGWRLTPRGRMIKNDDLWKRVDNLVKGRHVAWDWKRHGEAGHDHDACCRLAIQTAVAQSLLGPADQAA